ncbi:hypothetical protein C2E23DRAFT_442592 [Lenzites betulinus]|nr:hypothetical protein C2E23DRAFT_442592 [Lenzites betulinus]
MATNLRFPMRNRTGPQRPKNADENAMSKHVRQASGIALAGASRVPATHAVKAIAQRAVLTEVTTTTVNRMSKVRVLHILRSFRIPPSLRLPGMPNTLYHWIRVVQLRFLWLRTSVNDGFHGGRSCGWDVTWALSRVEQVEMLRVIAILACFVIFIAGPPRCNGLATCAFAIVRSQSASCSC